MSQSSDNPYALTAQEILSPQIVKGVSDRAQKATTEGKVKQMIIPEIPPKDLIEPKVSENAIQVLERRYLIKDDKGEVTETVREMFWRVARTMASNEYNYRPEKDATVVARDFYNMMANLDFLPNSPTMMNAGRALGQLSACFVIPVDDSMEGIFNAIKHAAIVHKSGGGTGFSFSRIRPKASLVASTAGTASGPISFMSVFNAATETIKQGGTRRGANMGILRVDHPDIRDFITCKADMQSITNFNISVAVTDEFMNAVIQGEKYDLVDPRTMDVFGQEDAREIYNLIAENAWKNGDPGLVFIDEINRCEKTPHLGQVESTNPCGEQPLLPYESCNLGSINLDHMITDGKEVDWDKLRRTVRLGVRFLDNVVDVNKYPLEEISQITRANRRIGLGIMGFADMLFTLGIPYDSQEGVDKGRKIMRFIQEEARQMSDELADERGVFDNFDGSVHEKPTRNSTVTTIAPTGTISMIAETSGGIEPCFALCYVKRVMDDDRLLYTNHRFEEAARNGGWYSKEIMDKIADGVPINKIDSIPKSAKRVFRTAHDITPEWHITMQAAFQEWTENAVSKTINFPHESSIDDVKNTYMMAWQERCKGITIYRDGSRDDQVLNVGKKLAGKEKVEQPKEIPAQQQTAIEMPRKALGTLTPRKRPALTRGTTEQIETGQGTLYLTINEDEFGLCEVFASIGKSGGTAFAQSEAIGRLISLALRSGVSPWAIVNQLKGITGANPVWHKGDLIRSTPDAVGKALERYLNRKENQQGELDFEAEHSGNPEYSVKVDSRPINILPGDNGRTAQRVETLPSTEECPKCHNNTLIFQEGCARCLDPGCSYSKC